MMRDIKSVWGSFDRLTQAMGSAIADCEERSKVRGYLMNAVWEHFAIYRSLPNLQSEKELIRAFEGVERILIELLHSLGDRHSLWVYRYTVPRHEVARFKVVTFHPVDRSVVYVYETYIEQYAVRIAQAWRMFMLDDETDLKLLAILQNGTVLDCPSRLVTTP